MPDGVLLVERAGHVCTLTLNRPEKRNALNPELLTRLTDTFQGLAGEGDVRVVVLRGAGEVAFSAGYDVTRLEEEAARRRGRGEGFFDTCLAALLTYPRPVIAMISGYAIGGGLELAAACDLRIAADNARLGLATARMGQVEPYPVIQMFLSLLGTARTKELFFTGRTLDAWKAREMGVVDRVVPAGDLAATTYELAQEIADNSPVSVTTIKYVLSRLLEGQRPTPELAAHLHEVVLRAERSEDAQEGARAFLERRRPRFTGNYPPPSSSGSAP